jgi:hypothetical protein
VLNMSSRGPLDKAQQHVLCAGRLEVGDDVGDPDGTHGLGTVIGQLEFDYIRRREGYAKTVRRPSKSVMRESRQPRQYTVIC